MERNIRIFRGGYRDSEGEFTHHSDDRPVLQHLLRWVKLVVPKSREDFSPHEPIQDASRKDADGNQAVSVQNIKLGFNHRSLGMGRSVDAQIVRQWWCVANTVRRRNVRNHDH